MSHLEAWALMSLILKSSIELLSVSVALLQNWNFQPQLFSSWGTPNGSWMCAPFTCAQSLENSSWNTLQIATCVSILTLGWIPASVQGNQSIDHWKGYSKLYLGLPDNEYITVKKFRTRIRPWISSQGGSCFHVLMKNNNLKLFVDTIACTCPAG